MPPRSEPKADIAPSISGVRNTSIDLSSTPATPPPSPAASSVAIWRPILTGGMFLLQKSDLWMPKSLETKFQIDRQRGGSAVPTRSGKAECRLHWKAGWAHACSGAAIMCCRVTRASTLGLPHWRDWGDPPSRDWVCVCVCVCVSPATVILKCLFFEIFFTSKNLSPEVTYNDWHSSWLQRGRHSMEVPPKPGP